MKRALLAACAAGIVSLSPSAAFSGRLLRAERHQLANGLTVILHEDHSLPIVAVNVWYNVGSKNEEKGKSGFAHLFEHYYMFEGSSHVPRGQFDKIVYAAGGYSQAYTERDWTSYVDVVPSENLEELLRLESDRMGFLNIGDPALFEKQRRIVKQEMHEERNVAFGDNGARLAETIFENGHPYRSDWIGSSADLDKASLEDIRRFHADFYRPNNAILTVSGDHDRRSTLAMVRKWFESIPAGPPPPAPPFPGASPPSAARRLFADDKAQSTELLMGFRIPGKGSPGWLELSALASILAEGRSSRLVRSLRDERGLVQKIEAGLWGLKETDLFVITAVLAEGAAPAEVENAVNAEIERLAKEGVRPPEMRRMKAQWLTGQLDALQNAENVAEALARGQHYEGDPAAVERQKERILRMKPSAPQQAAQQHLRPENGAVVVIAPETGRKEP